MMVLGVARGQGRRPRRARYRDRSATRGTHGGAGRRPGAPADETSARAPARLGGDEPRGRRGAGRRGAPRLAALRRRRGLPRDRVRRSPRGGADRRHRGGAPSSGARRRRRRVATTAADGSRRTGASHRDLTGGRHLVLHGLLADRPGRAARPRRDRSSPRRDREVRRLGGDAAAARGASSRYSVTAAATTRPGSAPATQSRTVASANSSTAGRAARKPHVQARPSSMPEESGRGRYRPGRIGARVSVYGVAGVLSACSARTSPVRASRTTIASAGSVSGGGGT